MLRDQEVAGSNPVSPTRRKTLLPKQFLLTPGRPGRGLRVTRSVKVFHRTRETAAHAPHPQVHPLLPPPPTVRPRPRRLDRPDRHTTVPHAPRRLRQRRVPDRVHRAAARTASRPAPGPDTPADQPDDGR